MDHEVLDDFSEDRPQPTRFAGFWIRVGAALLDSLILLPLFILNMYNFLEFKMLSIYFILILIQSAYKPYMEYRYGATLGKMAVKIKVVNTSMGPITLNQSILRYGFQILNIFAGAIVTIKLFKIPEFQDVTEFMEFSAFQQAQGTDLMSMGASFLFMIAVIYVAFDQKKQGLHDKIAQTYCVYKEV